MTAAMNTKAPIGVAVVGCGGFATATHLPNLARLPDYRLVAAADIDEGRARAVAEQYDLPYGTTDYARVLADPAVDLVVITTTHDQHAPMAVQAAEAGKHILLEKPMGMNRDEVAAVVEAVRRAGVIFAIGFNRRFAPLSERAAALLAGRPQPWMIHYRMVDAVWKHWAIDPVMGGGRIISETCHIFDYLCRLTGSEPIRIFAEAGSLTHPQYPTTQDNAVITLRFANGSIASITHGDLGHNGYAKESIEVFSGHGTIVLTNFLRLDAFGFSEQETPIELPAIDKGHRRELEVLAEALRTGTAPSIDERAGARAMTLCFAAIESARTGKAIELDRAEAIAPRTAAGTN
jgi:predicted dehydrogenase